MEAGLAELAALVATQADHPSEIVFENVGASRELQKATPIRIPRRQTTRLFFLTLPWRSSKRSGSCTIGKISRQAPPGE